MTTRHTARAARADPAIEDGDSVLHVSVVMTRHIPIKSGDENGRTFGQIVDAQLEEAAMGGERVNGFELEISEPQWFDFERRVRGSGRPAGYAEQGD